MVNLKHPYILVGAFCETLLVTFFFFHTERSTSLGLLTLLASNFGCFQKVPLLATIVFKAFVVTRQLGFFYFFRHCETFPPKYLNATKGFPLCFFLIFCNQLDDKKGPFFCVFRRYESVSKFPFLVGAFSF